MQTRYPARYPVDGAPVKAMCLALALLFALGAGSGSASQRTLRCQGRLVSIGDSRSEVRQKCGEPDRISERQVTEGTTVARIFDYETERYQAPERIDTPIRLESWVYDSDTTRLARTLHFENDRLIRIETGPKVGE